MDLTLFITIALYILGLLHSFIGFFQKRQVFVKIALGMVAAGFLFHTLFLFLLGLERGHFPITNLPESLCVFAWFVSLAFIVANFRYKINALGAFVHTLRLQYAEFFPKFFEGGGAHFQPLEKNYKHIYINKT